MSAHESGAVSKENSSFDILLTRKFAKLTQYFPNFWTNCIQPVQGILLMPSFFRKEAIFSTLNQIAEKNTTIYNCEQLPIWWPYNMNSRSLVWASNKSLKRVECPLFLMCWFIYGNIISCRAFGRWGNKLVVAFFSVILGVTCTINFLVLLSVKRPFAAPSPPLTLGLDTRTGDFFSRPEGPPSSHFSNSHNRRRLL